MKNENSNFEAEGDEVQASGERGQDVAHDLLVMRKGGKMEIPPLEAQMPDLSEQFGVDW